jgi:phage terminase, small subunit
VILLAKTKQEQIQSSLLEQLKNKGLNKDFYIDLINDYMALWVVKQNLIKDIKERGVNIEYKNGENQYGTKQNDSVLNLIKTNSQMLKILSELGLKGAEQAGDIDEEL